MGELTLVSCVVCERSMQQPWINAKVAYPVMLVVNVNHPTGDIITSKIPGYVCERHYLEKRVPNELAN